MRLKSSTLTAILAALFIGAGAALAVLWLTATGEIDPTNPRQVALGEAVYRDHCAACHGAQLEGEPDWRTRKPTGELPAPPHDVTGHTWHHTDEQLFSIVKHGMARFAPPDYKTNMPSFVGTLKDGEIRAVLAYIKSTWPAEIQKRQASLDRR